MNKLIISFQTNSIPAPFAHAYVLELRNEREAVLAKFQLEYLDRDGLSPAELQEEGFTDDDNFEWEGELPKVWWNTVINKAIHTQLLDDSDPEVDYLHLSIKNESTTSEGVVGRKSLEDWLYSLQELTQAVYEASKAELPLTLSLKKGDNYVFKLQASFKDRTLRDQLAQENWPWGNLKKLLALLENMELSEKPKRKALKGVSLSYDDSEYYQIKSLNGSSSEDEIIRGLQKELKT